MSLANKILFSLFHSSNCREAREAFAFRPDEFSACTENDINFLKMPSEKGNCAICEKVSCKNLYKQELFKHLNCFALILIRMQIAETFDLLRKSRSDMFCLKRQIPKIGFKFQN